ncbi:Nucleic acid-binding, OB-fold [Sesbania bispinosa]|nr:Nucleic acid-binding, OB-fold [Sesbania bispinosa]
MTSSTADIPSVVHNIKDITIGSDSWNLKVKVLRVWSLPDAYNLADFACLEMIFIDGEETKISLAGPFFIPVSTLNVKTAEELLSKGDEIDYAFDFVGLLTAASDEQKFYKFGAFKRYICLEVTDHTAKMECVLYDEYVDLIQKYFTVNGRSRAIVLLQFVKLSPVGGVYFDETVIQNMFSATRVFFNPMLAEVMDFMKSAALLGIDLDGRIAFLNRIAPTTSMHDDFLILHPPKKIHDLQVVTESFMCIIWAKVVKVINEGRWWYRVQVEVYDFNDSAYLNLDDSDVELILKKSCKELLHEVEDPLSREVPTLIKNLVGKQMLFKVLKISASDGYGDDVFKVDRICDDVNIVGKFFKGEALLIPQMLGSHNGLVEYKFNPLLRSCKAAKKAGDTRACPINGDTQSLSGAGQSGFETHLGLKNVSRRLDCEFQKELTTGKGKGLDKCGVVHFGLGLWSAFTCSRMRGTHLLVELDPRPSPKLMRLLNRRRVRIPGRKFFGVLPQYEGHIAIPRWFFHWWGDMLDDIVMLKDPVGNLFPVYICIRNGRGYFCLGIETLRVAYGMESMFTVAFSMRNSGSFKIRVFGPDCLEIDYPVVEI